MNKYTSTEYLELLVLGTIFLSIAVAIFHGVFVDQAILLKVIGG